MVRQKIEDGINIDSVRRSIIKVLARIQKQFGPEYGKMVLCYDDKNYWRSEVFPYYKKNRKQEREASKYDWDLVFSVLNRIRDEIRRHLPYYVIQVHGAEADDVIATLARSLATDKILVLSADKDFIQLQRDKRVKQYDPIRNRWIENEDPIHYLQEHIVRGDRSDGIPNILTCDDAIVNGKAQKKMSKEKISALASMKPEDFTNFIRLRNWKRNSELIDFSNIPSNIKNNIIMKFTKYRLNKSIDLQYFIDNNIQDLIEEFS
tara:strand:+ start:151 stop:939 length:789 start_codon:yes stop_codon:yes gene_type:complete